MLRVRRRSVHLRACGQGEQQQRVHAGRQGRDGALACRHHRPKARAGRVRRPVGRAGHRGESRGPAEAAQSKEGGPHAAPRKPCAPRGAALRSFRAGSRWQAGQPVQQVAIQGVRRRRLQGPRRRALSRPRGAPRPARPHGGHRLRRSRSPGGRAHTGRPPLRQGRRGPGRRGARGPRRAVGAACAGRRDGIRVAVKKRADRPGGARRLCGQENTGARRKQENPPLWHRHAPLSQGRARPRADREDPGGSRRRGRPRGVP